VLRIESCVAAFSAAGLGKFRNPGGIGFSEAPKLLLDAATAIAVVLGVVFASPVVDLLYAAVSPRIRYKV